MKLIKLLPVLLCFGLVGAAFANVTITPNSSYTVNCASETPPPSTKLVCLGDSITYGLSTIGVTTTDTFCYKLGQKFNSYLNKGVPGENTSEMLTRFSADVLAQSPTHLTIMAGMNDCLEISAVTFKSNVLSMVQQAKAAGIKVTLMSTILPRTSTRYSVMGPFLQALREVADQEDVDFIDVYGRYSEQYWSNVNTFSSWYAQTSSGAVDVIHPNPAGHQAIVDMCKYSKASVCNP